MSSTTTPRSPRPDEPGARPPRLIHNEVTTEIPVHLLFRDEPEAPPVDLPPAVVGRRHGTGEQPRTDHPFRTGEQPRTDHPFRTGEQPRTDHPFRTGEQPRSEHPFRADQQPWPDLRSPQRAPVRRAAPASVGARSAPDIGPVPVERLGRALPGAVGVLAGLAGIAGCLVTLWWAGVLPPLLVQLLGLPAYAGGGYAGVGLGKAGLGGAGFDVPRLTGRGLGGGDISTRQWAALAASGTVALFGFGGLARGRVGRASVLTLFGRYRGSVRRTGLMWVNPLLLRRGVDVRLRHWRSEPMPAVDANGVALRAVVLVVWRIKDTARATLAVADHQEYLRECVEAALARVLSQLPADAFRQDAPTLRDAEAVGDALTGLLAAETAPVGLEVFSAQPTRIEYAPEVAAAMQRRRIAALDAQHRDTVLTSVVDSVEDTVTRLTVRGLVELDDYERKALVKDLTVAFCTGRNADSPP
ncbi:SPFH domain-containing protein [Streptomyces sp. NPDC058001]|uniref:SPFH domain-containing protein n=1 Tax=Streptomyces sp. NPDC058001 TaxID=3346300 RepID=UPI0036E54163